MNTLSQIRVVTALNISTIVQRLGTSLVIVAGTAGVVAVLVSIIALSSGLKQTINAAGRVERAVVLYKGAQSESGSSMSRDAMLNVFDKPGIVHDGAGKPRATADVVSSLWLPHINDPTPGSVTLRGVSEHVLSARPEITLVEGKMFTPGLKQVIVGTATRRAYAHLAVGDKILADGNEWQIVGAFQSGGDLHESEIWSDAESVLSGSHRGNFNSVTAWVENDAGYDQLKAAIEADPMLTVDLHHEIEFFTSQSSGFSTFLSLVANVIGGIMAVGAMFGSINAMYTAVSTRTREIATLRAIGFGPTGIVLSVFSEAMLLAVGGAVVGAVIAWLFFNGNSISTRAGNNGMAQVVFDLHIGLHELTLGIAWGLALGLIGGLFPAIRAARMPVVAALRAA